MADDGYDEDFDEAFEDTTPGLLALIEESNGTVGTTLEQSIGAATPEELEQGAAVAGSKGWVAVAKALVAQNVQSAAPAALLAAAAHGHARLLEDLAREAAVRDLLPQVRDPLGRTVLHAGASAGHENVVSALLELGLGIEGVTDQSGATAADAAKAAGHLGIAAMCGGSSAAAEPAAPAPAAPEPEPAAPEPAPANVVEPAVAEPAVELPVAMEAPAEVEPVAVAAEEPPAPEPEMAAERRPLDSEPVPAPAPEPPVAEPVAVVEPAPAEAPPAAEWAPPQPPSPEAAKPKKKAKAATEDIEEDVKPTAQPKGLGAVRATSEPPGQSRTMENFRDENAGLASSRRNPLYGQGVVSGSRSTPFMVSFSQYKTCPKWSFRSRDHLPKRQRKFDSPGPGAYNMANADKFKYPGGPGFGFGKGPRFIGDAAMQAQPGPGQYSPSDPNLHAGARYGFGTSLRTAAKSTVHETPPPGTYDVKTGIGTGSGFTQRGKPKPLAEAGMDSPGPGAYNPSMKVYEHGARFSFGNASRDSGSENTAHKLNCPGPGAYAVTKTLGHGAAKFSIVSRPLGWDSAPAGNRRQPGPGAYNAHITSFGY